MTEAEKIKKRYRKIVEECDKMEENILSALVLVYNERLKELEQECEELTGHDWYEVYFGSQSICKNCDARKQNNDAKAENSSP
jgi:predicted metal-dependent peptidase